MGSGILVLRSFFISPSLDERMKEEAFIANISKNELLRRYLDIGMAVIDNKNVNFEPPIKQIKNFYKGTEMTSKESFAASLKFLKSASRARKIADKGSVKASSEVAAKSSVKKAASKDSAKKGVGRRSV